MSFASWIFSQKILQRLASGHNKIALWEKYRWFNCVRNQMLKASKAKALVSNFCSHFLPFIFSYYILQWEKLSRLLQWRKIYLEKKWRRRRSIFYNQSAGKAFMHLCALKHRRTCAFLPWAVVQRRETSIASFLYQLYCQHECVCVHCSSRRGKNLKKASFPPDANGSLCAKEKTQKNEIKLQNSNQLIFSSFYLFFLLLSRFRRCFCHAFYLCFVFFSYISFEHIFSPKGTVWEIFCI